MSARPRLGRTSVVLSVLMLWTTLGAAPVGADDTLGGGSDLPADAVIGLPRGGSLPRLHHVFADNPGSRPIEVRFHAEVSKGIKVRPEWGRRRIAPQTSVTNRFAVTVADTVPPGDHRVTVQLIRSDITPQPGKVTNIPAVGATFTVRVSGQAAGVTVRAISAESGRAVHGTLSLSAMTDPRHPIEVARANTRSLKAVVAPGDYRATFLLAGRELATKKVHVDPDDTLTVSLRVNTVSFISVVAKPVEEDGKVVVVNLRASLENHLKPLTGGTTIRATGYRDGKRIGTVTLDTLDTLPAGVTEVRAVYRPDGGFQPGAYRFTFELVAPEFTLRAADEPTFGVSRPFSILIAGLVMAVVLALLAGIWLAARRRRKRR